MLIQKEADVSIPNNRGIFPLNIAFVKSHACARVLINAHADMTLISSNGWPMLVCASFYGTPIDILEDIILQGGDLNVTTGHGATPLMSAAQEGHQHCCEYLISRGADPNRVNKDGEGALHIAIFNRRSEPTRLLLAHGAPHSPRNKAGESLLHYGAMYGDVAILAVLQSFHLQGIDPKDTITCRFLTQDSKDVVGRTAAQIAEQRSDVTPEWHEAFRRLVRAVEMANEGHNDPVSAQSHIRSNSDASNLTGTEEDSDYFEDAVEHQMQLPSLSDSDPGRAHSRSSRCKYMPVSTLSFRNKKDARY